MNILKLLFLPVLFVLSMVACVGDDDSPTPPDEENPMDTTTIDTSKVCLLLYDENGSPIGTYGDCESNDLDFQWKNNPSLTAGQKALFDFLEFADISEAVTPEIGDVFIYPNPIPNGRVVSFQFPSTTQANVKLKYVFTDLDDNPIRRSAISLPTNANLQMILEEADFPFGQAYRFYYQVLANEDTEVIFEGYGNIAICDAWPVVDVGVECFEN